MRTTSLPWRVMRTSSPFSTEVDQGREVVLGFSDADGLHWGQKKSLARILNR
jgi:hypothetical protein